MAFAQQCGEQHEVVVVHEYDVALLPDLGDRSGEGLVQVRVVLPPLVRVRVRVGVGARVGVGVGVGVGVRVRTGLGLGLGSVSRPKSASSSRPEVALSSSSVTWSSLPPSRLHFLVAAAVGVPSALTVYVV